MIRTPVDSSNIHSIGHDETGLEVQFHATDCPRRRSSSRRDYSKPGVCSCKGGDVFHYPGFPAELHTKLMEAKSVGSHFMKHVRGAKNAKGELLYPASLKRGSAVPDDPA